jgi:hypothetical protein
MRAGNGVKSFTRFPLLEEKKTQLVLAQFANLTRATMIRGIG